MFVIPPTRIIQYLGALRVETLIDSGEQEQSKLTLIQGLARPPGRELFLYPRNWLHIPGDRPRELTYPGEIPATYEAGINCSQQGMICELELHESNNHTMFRVNGRSLSLLSNPQCPLTHGDFLQIGTDITLRYEALFCSTA